MPETLQIRFMEERDLDQVAAIEKKYFSMPWSRRNFLDSLKLAHTIYVVAEIDSRIAGYCGCYQMLEEAEIVNVAVDETFRGRGIGYRMLTELMRLGEKQGAFAYTLEVRVSNAPAIRLYESLGFESLGIRKNFYEKPVEDAMIMWRKWMVSEEKPL
ncbi:MAG: ribosomal protein S18-alanine N-acetyltransferase [Lachnospiraceae bacterium]|nr:ribosomal protein S18-alanine N-acetyltransferase [Lachnospiraceae bacterium]